MADREDDLLAQAIANTETEIFGEAVGKEAPSDSGEAGDRSAEEMGSGLEGQHEPDEAEEGDEVGEGEGAESAEAKAGEGDQEGKGEPERDPETGQFKAKDKVDEGKVDQNPNRRVPLAELLNERKARQELETKLKEANDLREKERGDSRSEFEKLNARLDTILAAQRPQQTTQQTTQPQAEQQSDGDLLFEDPNRFVANLTQTIERQVTQRFVSADLARTHGELGEKFEKAYSALTALDKNDPTARATVQRIWASPTPGRDLVKWHEQQEALRTIGDPTLFREKTRQELRDELAKDPEFRKQLLEGLREEAKGSDTGGAPRSVTRLPKSLNAAAGGSNGTPANSGGGRFSGDASDRGVFEDAFRS